MVVPVEPQLIVEAEKYQRIEQNVVLFVFDGMGIEPLSEFQIFPAIVDGDPKIGVAAVIGEAVMARFAESKLVDQGIDAVYNLPVFHPLECTEQSYQRLGDVVVDGVGGLDVHADVATATEQVDKRVDVRGHVGQQLVQNAGLSAMYFFICERCIGKASLGCLCSFRSCRRRIRGGLS